MLVRQSRLLASSRPVRNPVSEEGDGANECNSKTFSGLHIHTHTHSCTDTHKQHKGMHTQTHTVAQTHTVNTKTHTEIYTHTQIHRHTQGQVW